MVGSSFAPGWDWGWILLLVGTGGGGIGYSIIMSQCGLSTNKEIINAMQKERAENSHIISYPMNLKH